MLQYGHANAEGEGGIAQQQRVPKVEDLVQWEHVCMRHNTTQGSFCFFVFTNVVNNLKLERLRKKTLKVNETQRECGGKTGLGFLRFRARLAGDTGHFARS